MKPHTHGPDNAATFVLSLSSIFCPFFLHLFFFLFFFRAFHAADGQHFDSQLTKAFTRLSLKKERKKERKKGKRKDITSSERRKQVNRYSWNEKKKKKETTTGAPMNGYDAGRKSAYEMAEPMAWWWIHRYCVTHTQRPIGSFHKYTHTHVHTQRRHEYGLCNAVRHAHCSTDALHPLLAQTLTILRCLIYNLAHALMSTHWLLFHLSAK